MWARLCNKSSIFGSTGFGRFEFHINSYWLIWLELKQLIPICVLD